MRGFKQALVLPCLLLPFLFEPCANQKKQPEPPAAGVPADFTIQFGQGGGFTGLWEGFTIHANGAILRWQGRSAGENAKRAGRLTPEQVRELWEQIQSIRFFSRDVSDTGNMTTVITVTANKRRHRVSWPSGGAQVAAQTEALRQLQQFCIDLVEKARR